MQLGVKIVTTHKKLNKTKHFLEACIFVSADTFAPIILYVHIMMNVIV